jgi:hypothetical protein
LWSIRGKHEKISIVLSQKLKNSNILKIWREKSTIEVPEKVYKAS